MNQILDDIQNAQSPEPHIGTVLQEDIDAAIAAFASSPADGQDLNFQDVSAVEEYGDSAGPEEILASFSGSRRSSPAEDGPQLMPMPLDGVDYPDRMSRPHCSNPYLIDRSA